MTYEAELNFFRNLMERFHIKTHIITGAFTSFAEVDLGIRQFLGREEEYDQIFPILSEVLRPNTIYKVTDNFMTNYILLELPDTEETSYLAAGPYTERIISQEDFLYDIEKYHLPPKVTETLIQYYITIPTVQEPAFFRTVFCTLGDTLWGDPEQYTFDSIHYSLLESYLNTIPDRPLSNLPEASDVSFKMDLLERRYALENHLIRSVSQGNYHQAETYFEYRNLLIIENRADDPLRNFKNYTIVFNTLLRKGAEAGFVPPLYIDRLSSTFAKRIEELSSPEQGPKLMREMLRKYCLLVKNHSMKDFSLLIQKVITRIDADLTADQSLKTHAAMLNVNPSYLSSLFRKETGITLTEYVNRKRIEHGIFLLNTTNLQIQVIAQYCGMPDINYFTRVFKKYIGKTPKEYKKGLLHE